MITLNTLEIPHYAKKKTEAFFSELLDIYNYNVHSIYIAGEGLCGDVQRHWVESIVILQKSDDLFIDVTARVAKNYLKKPLSPPLIMTIDEIESYIDIFPLRFLNYNITHQTIYGFDLFADLNICHQTLLNQCRLETRNILNRLINDYIETGGDRGKIAKKIKKAFRGDIPLFRGLIKLTGVIPPVNHKDVIVALPDVARIGAGIGAGIGGIGAGIFKTIYEMDTKSGKLPKDFLEKIYDEYYAVINELDKKLEHSV